MTTEELEITSSDWQSCQAEVSLIRQQVFMLEQGVSEEEEWDGKDPEAIHFLAYRGNEPVGCARLLPDGKIGRMAVLAPYRRQGIGSALLQHVIHYAEHNFPELFLDAQVQAQDFYSRFAFFAEGPEFEDAGMPHRRMHLQLNAVDKQEVDTGVVRLDGPHACLTAIQTLAAKGRFSLDILTEQLTPFIYANSDLVAAISALARRSRRSTVRILVKDTKPLGGAMHGLVQLSQRLPSRMAIRGLREMPKDPYMGYFLVDKEALVYFNQESAYTGFSNASARAEARNLLIEFDHLWEHYSFADPNLRALQI